MRYSKTYDLFTDYSQFWLHDIGADVNQTVEMWDDESSARMMAIRPDIVCVGTIRNSHAPVTIEIADAEPPEAPPGVWDQINECSLLIPVGSLVIHDDILGETGSHETISLPVGCYRMRVYYGNLDAQHSALEGEDHYLVVLWPGDQIGPRVIRQKQTRKDDRTA